MLQTLERHIKYIGLILSDEQTLPHNCHDYVRIRVLLNIFNIRSISLNNETYVVYFLLKEAFHPLLITSISLIFKGDVNHYIRWE